MPRLTFATALALLAAPVLAGRPLVTETADALERGDCEIEAAWARATAGDGRTAHGGEGILSCGVGGSTQLGAGYARVSGDGTVQAVQFAGKTSVSPPAEGRPGWGVAYRATALKNDGGSFEGELFTLAGLVTQELGDRWLLHANLGLARNRLVGDTRIRWWLGVERPGTLFYAADLFGNDAGQSFASAGVGWAFGEAFSVNLAAACQLGGGSARDLSLGLKIAF